MEIIEVTPYQKIEKRVFNDDLTLLIKKENFDNQEFIDGRSTFFVSECDFKKVLIENNDEIDFKILISFSGCYVHDLQITAINSQKINIHFFSTILSGMLITK